MESRSCVHVAITDNWLLELASRQIDFGLDIWLEELEFATCDYRSFDHVMTKRTRRDRLEALLHLLDLLLFYDEILYDEETSWVWKQRSALGPLSQILKPAPTATPGMEDEPKPRAIYSSYGREPDTVVRRGSLYYLALSANLGVPYWPAPERLAFLSKSDDLLPIETFFFPSLLKHMERELQEMVQEALGPLPDLAKSFRFLGLSTFVLAHSASREHILATAVDLRETKECAALRKWLAEVESASRRGDIPLVCRALRDVEEVVSAARRGLKIGTHKSNEIELQIGLTPSFVVNEGAIRALVRRFTPKPLHVVFLRRASQEALRYCNTSWHVRRLFEGRRERAKRTANPGIAPDG